MHTRITEKLLAWLDGFRHQFTQAVVAGIDYASIPVFIHVRHSWNLPYRVSLYYLTSLLFFFPLLPVLAIVENRYIYQESDTRYTVIN